MTEIEAINRMLSAIGQAPVTTVDQTNPDVAICSRTLTQVSQEVQSEGWTFNTYYNKQVSPDTDEHIIIRPTNILSGTGVRDHIIQMDLSYNTFYSRDKESIAKQNGSNIYLYDKTNNTYKWGTEPVEVDTVEYVANLASLPPAAQNYIISKASTRVSMRTVGDSQQFSILRQEEEYARTQLQQYEMSQGDYTFFGHPKGANYYNSYKPFHTLSR